ncbi:hypothetical protein BH23CHL5_BH23CHL5_02510 [soil metagenome]
MRATAEPDFLALQLATMAPHRALLRSIECRFMFSVPLLHPVLDVGCGDGHFASIAFDEPIDVGLDPMDRDLAEAATLPPHVYMSLVKGSATRMPFANEVFATVVSNSVIEHIPDVESTLAEISRVLKPGGTFVTTLPSEHYPAFLLGSTLLQTVGLTGFARAYGQFYNRISHHFHIDPPEVWSERLDRAGLTVIEHRYYFSRRAHHAFDTAHILGIPNLASKRVLGKWVIHPWQAKPYERWYRRYYEETFPEIGAYQFIRCSKR